MVMNFVPIFLEAGFVIKWSNLGACFIVCKAARIFDKTRQCHAINLSLRKKLFKRFSTCTTVESINTLI